MTSCPITLVMLHRGGFTAGRGSISGTSRTRGTKGRTRNWPTKRRTGYKIVRVPLENGKAQGEYEDFVTGFVTPQGNVWGRPVGVAVGKDGSLFFSEDAHGTIWRVSVSR